MVLFFCLAVPCVITNQCVQRVACYFEAVLPLSTEDTFSFDVWTLIMTTKCTAYGVKWRMRHFFEEEIKKEIIIKYINILKYTPVSFFVAGDLGDLGDLVHAAIVAAIHPLNKAWHCIQSKWYQEHWGCEIYCNVPTRDQHVSQHIHQEHVEVLDIHSCSFCCFCFCFRFAALSVDLIHLAALPNFFWPAPDGMRPPHACLCIHVYVLLNFESSLHI